MMICTGPFGIVPNGSLLARAASGGFAAGFGWGLEYLWWWRRSYGWADADDAAASAQPMATAPTTLKAGNFGLRRRDGTTACRAGSLLNGATQPEMNAPF